MRSSTILVFSASISLLPGVLAAPAQAQLPTVSFSPAGGNYTAAQKVTLTSSDPNAKIYYSMKGTSPSDAILYTGPLTVSSSQTIHAAALTSDSAPYTISSADYNITGAGQVLSADFYTFAATPVGAAVTKTVATAHNSVSQAEAGSYSITGDKSFTLVPSQSCGAQVPGYTSCPLVVQYKPSAAGTQTATLTLTYSGAYNGVASMTLKGSASGQVNGSVSSTTNPLVALYTVTPGSDAQVTVEFGPDTSYGYTTTPISTKTSSGPVSVEVGGMRADSTYHMRAQIAYANGTTSTTSDATFKTGSLPSDLAKLKIVATTEPGMTPQPGIELIDPVVLQSGTWRPLATDLQGNVIWYYPWADFPGYPYLANGIKQLPNGDFLAALSPGSSAYYNNFFPDPSKVYIREFDLIGNTVKQLTLADLNSRLASAGYKRSDGSALVLEDFHHDITALPNGHWLVLASNIKMIGGEKVQGDVIIDVDTNLQPVWVWQEFNHLDTSRRPVGGRDFTHTNAVLYSPTDGNIVVSIRHQNWVIKVKYQDGLGDGSILWKLGNQGTFTLMKDGKVDTNPYDWPYAQHGPSFVSSVTAGTFDLAVMDNGNDRIVAGNVGNCPTDRTKDCYTTVPVFRIDEDAKTATIEDRVTLPVPMYSNFGGNAEVLANQDLEYGLSRQPNGSSIYEVLQDSSHTPVWSLKYNSGNFYRGFRLPSLYPGVQWR